MIETSYFSVGQSSEDHLSAYCPFSKHFNKLQPWNYSRNHLQSSGQPFKQCRNTLWQDLCSVDCKVQTFSPKSCLYQANKSLNARRGNLRFFICMTIINQMCKYKHWLIFYQELFIMLAKLKYAVSWQIEWLALCDATIIVWQIMDDDLGFIDWTISIESWDFFMKTVSCRNMWMNQPIRAENDSYWPIRVRGWEMTNGVCIK